ncbi:MAG: uracil-DNA glycosylase [Synergistaceae bacterium]|nr:uracil-DNA glycosylase [Synergistota bacterium]NLM71648.1 uracil-DNA glycosylase [Synergistaceae bacterium]
MSNLSGGISRQSAWEELEGRVRSCTACDLCRGRKNTVFGQGNRSSSLVFVGEGPGADEDEQGTAFVGRAGKLLTAILQAADIEREDVFITNIVKCRPPNNRIPLAKEMMACNPFLEAQLALLRPKIVVCLGNTALKWLMKTSEGISSLRGRWFPWRGILLFPMFHPSYLLRNDSRKKGSPKELTWQDIIAVKEKLDALTAEEGVF